MELCAVFGLLAIVFALNLQPWHWRLKYPLGMFGLTLIVIGLTKLFPKVILLSVPLIGFLLMLRHLYIHRAEYKGR